MSTIKVIEVLAQSEKGWEDAADNALKAAQRTVRNVQSIYIKEMNADVKDGQIANYRINAKISFALDE